jgi:hypothetical protein
MLTDTASAPLAMMTTDVDLTDDAPADPLAVSRRRLLDDADEFVAWDTLEIGVAVEQLQVGPADAGAPDADEALISAARPGQIFELNCCRSGDDESFHETRLGLGGMRSRRYDDCELTGN